MQTLLYTAFALMLVCTAAPVLLFLFNLRRYRTPRTERTPEEQVAVLIPARDEEDNIRACVLSVLASRDVDLTVWVCDDHSTDRTAAIVESLAAQDPRVRLARAAPLPEGWNGKQHACWKLARCAAETPLLVFLDADVRLHPWAIANCMRMLRNHELGLLSGFPRQVCSGCLDRLLLPLIHFVLLAYLPLRWMQTSNDPRFAAGCGQFLLVDRSAYFASGGHVGIRASRHDGLRLPRLLREHGFATGLADLTTLASVNMYPNARATWNGLAKNATEGIAARGRIGVFTLLLLFGAVLPGLLFFGVLVCLLDVWLLYLYSGNIVFADPLSAIEFAAAALAIGGLSFLPRLIAVRRFRQPFWSAVLHPFGVLILLDLQWRAWMRERLGKPVAWRSRRYSSDTGSEISQSL